MIGHRVGLVQFGLGLLLVKETLGFLHGPLSRPDREWERNVAFRTRKCLSAALAEPAPVLTGPKAAIAGAPEEEENDINDHYEPEPVDLTPEQLAEMSKQELATVIPNDGRTLGQWLEQDQPRFRDGSLVLDWVTEAHRLRVLPFLERAEHLKSLSFDDLNTFRGRSREWVALLRARGILESPEPVPEEGVTVIPKEAYDEKLKLAREKYREEAVKEEVMLKKVDVMLEEARFEGTAMEGKVRVVMDGRMRPLSCTVTEGAMGDATLLSSAVEAAMDAAFKASSTFYEDTMTREYLSQAATPTDVQGIFDLLGEKEFAETAQLMDPGMEG